MAIPAQLPALIPLARTTIALDQLALRPGQSIQAQVVGTSPGGTTQLAVGGQTVELALPGRPQPGTTVQLQFQGSGPKASLVVVPSGSGASAPATLAASVAPGSGTSAPSPSAAVVSNAPNASAPSASTNLVSTATSASVPGTATATPQGSSVSVQTTPVVSLTGKAETTLQPIPVQANPTHQVITQTAQASALRQDSVGTLLASLSGLGGKLTAMPEPVARAGLQLLAARVNLDGKPLDGAALKDALLRSGSMLENGLQKGAVPAAQQGDMKASLLALRGALQGWLGKDASASLRSLRRPSPPVRGSIPRADPPSPSQMAPGASPKEAARMLLAQTESALSRIRLTQIASLPESAARATPDARPAGEWHFELPLAWGGEMSMAQFRISRDGGSHRADQERDWQMRFAINFRELGEVSAHASLRGKRLGVMIWAEREETAKALDGLLPELEASLSARGIEPGALRVKNGVPESPAQRAGQFMDGRL